MIFPTTYAVNWNRVNQRKRNQVTRDNNRENSRRRQHQYRVGDRVLVTKFGYDGEVVPKLARPTRGPYRVLRVFTNGTARLQRRGYEETINIRRLRPYFSPP